MSRPEQPEIRLLRLVQAFSALCGQPLQVLDAAKGVDPAHLRGAETLMRQVAEDLYHQQGQTALADRIRGHLDPEWDKVPNGHCAECGEPWPCAQSQRTDIASDLRALHVRDPR